MIDFEKIKRLYKIGRQLDWSDIQSLVTAASRKTYAIGDYLIEEGSKRRAAFFIQSGLVRSYHVNEKGEEITIGIIKEFQPLASPDIVFFNQPSRFYFQALEETQVLTMDYDELQRILAKHPKLEPYRKDVLLNVLQRSIQRVESFVLYSPEERYLRFIEEHSDIVNRVPDKYIANVLGITPVSLSRIRKRIAERRQ